MGRFDNCFNGCPALETVIVNPGCKFNFYSIDNSFDMIDKSKCTFYVSKNAMGIEYALKWGYKIVLVDDNPTDNTQVQNVASDSVL